VVAHAARFGGAGVSPPVLRSNGNARIASGTLARPNPALLGKVRDHRSTLSQCGEKCGLTSEGSNVFRMTGHTALAINCFGNAANSEITWAG
jgi:hypothetical protein